MDTVTYGNAPNDVGTTNATANAHTHIASFDADPDDADAADTEDVVLFKLTDGVVNARVLGIRAGLVGVEAELVGKGSGGAGAKGDAEAEHGDEVDNSSREIHGE